MDQKKIIKFRQELFWDVNPEDIDPDKNSIYIIERILDFGNSDEVLWMNSYYPKELIFGVVQKSRVLHEKSRSLWNLVYQSA